MAQLFSPFKLRSLELKNRIVVSPMCEYSAVDGFSNDWHLVHLGSRAVGGAGAVIAEATAVSPEGRITPDDLGLWKEEQIAGLARITRFLAEQGAVPGIQLAHAGRKASRTSPWKGEKLLPPEEGGWTMVSASDLPFKEGERSPVSLGEAGIHKVIEDFTRSAGYALTAGFQIIEIHAAHGYLIHQFLSPLSNHRKDGYGGSFDNRTRLLREITTSIRKVWPAELPLFVRLSASDWHPEGWTREDSIRLALELKPLGVDLVDCSSGGIIPGVKIPLEPGYQVPLAAAVKAGAGIPTGAVGLITEAHQSEAILEKGEADLIFFARQLLRDPYFPLHAAHDLGVDIPWPSQYLRAKI
jgi:2,4-dienoyl-CoA reductase-like NADH-dependent reductase (Old Yellow Enzyme family)